ncbi:MAG: hypothetical protein ACI8VT_003245 [Saprospiraceae bacterium]|jgi:hypothetical protein
MKQVIKYLFFASILLISGAISSCGSNKTGCPVNESVHTKSDRKGNLSTKRGKSSLFPKNMTKKKKKGK